MFIKSHITIAFRTQFLTHKAYRLCVRRLSGRQARLDFLPVVMKDLQFMADGNPKSIDGLINFDRFAISSSCILTHSSFMIKYNHVTHMRCHTHILVPLDTLLNASLRLLARLAREVNAHATTPFKRVVADAAFQSYLETARAPNNEVYYCSLLYLKLCEINYIICSLQIYQSGG